MNFFYDKKNIVGLIDYSYCNTFYKTTKKYPSGCRACRYFYTVPRSADVDSILSIACKDCHSNNTRYPWYNNLQPVAWFLANHVKDGKRSFNLNEFATYPVARQYDKIQEIKKQIDKGNMPISSYKLIHRDAILNDAEKRTVVTWSENIRQQMEAKYPKDSLERKRRPVQPVAGGRQL